MKLSVVTLNVNGQRGKRKRDLLFDCLRKEKFDIILLQETHISSIYECLKWNREVGMKGFWSIGTMMSRGVGVLVREDDRFSNFNFKCDIEGRVVVLDATFDEQDFRFISVYAPTNGSERIEFFQNFDRYLVTRRKLIVGGDFNCLLDLEVIRIWVTQEVRN